MKLSLNIRQPNGSLESSSASVRIGLIDRCRILHRLLNPTKNSSRWSHLHNSKPQIKSPLLLQSLSSSSSECLLECLNHRIKPFPRDQSPGRRRPYHSQTNSTLPLLRSNQRINLKVPKANLNPIDPSDLLQFQSPIHFQLSICRLQCRMIGMSSQGQGRAATCLRWINNQAKGRLINPFNYSTHRRSQLPNQINLLKWTSPLMDWRSLRECLQTRRTNKDC